MLDQPSAAPRSARRTSLSLALISALIAAPLALAPVSFASADEGAEPAAVGAVVETSPVEPAVAESVVAEPIAAEPAAEEPAAAEPVAAVPIEPSPVEAPVAETPATPTPTPAPARVARAAAALPTPTLSVTTSIDSVTLTWDQHIPDGENWYLYIEQGDPTMSNGGWGGFLDYQGLTTMTVPYPKHTPVAFRVRSGDMSGNQSEWATSGTVIVGQVPGTVPNLGFTPTSAGLNLRWMYPDEGSGDMVVDVQYRKSTVDDSAAWISAPSNAWQLTGLAGETQYDVRVRGTNPVGSSAWTTASATTLASTPPTEPTSVSSASALGTVSILWSAPTDAGSSAVTGYEWAWKLHSQTDSEWTQVSATSSPGTHIASGFPQSHDLRVRAVNAGGPGPWSTTVSATPQSIFIPPMIPIAPGAPTNIVLTGADSTINASWTAATGTVTSYSVSVTTPGEAARTFSQATTSLEIAGLTNGKSYLVTVTPYNQYVAGIAISESGLPWVFAPVFTLADGSFANGAKLKAGDKITISGVGAIPLMSVYAELHSAPIALGSTMTDGSGSFSFTVAIPKSAPSGSHSLFVYMAGDGGTVDDSAISVSIPSVAGVTAAAVDTDGTLAITGADPSGAFWLALVALLGGVALTVRSRRRSA